MRISRRVSGQRCEVVVVAEEEEEVAVVEAVAPGRVHGGLGTSADGQWGG